MRCDQVPNIEQGYRKMLTLGCGHIYAKGDSLPAGFVCKVCQIPTIQPENLIIMNLKNIENKRESIVDKNRRESIFDSFIIPTNFVIPSAKINKNETKEGKTEVLVFKDDSTIEYKKNMIFMKLTKFDSKIEEEINDVIIIFKDF